ncbi:ferredoxin reductase family protein [Ewingella americana]|uniref:ferredoxin reductase family protein n=1 Tax=Ewingella americana TaxID=41202 RepID=UPI0012ADB9E0|nr:ferric reductase-like transmembrane domain-containing protein [Ewingella americana]MRT05952.1 iron reductase [Ewingella americana]
MNKTINALSAVFLLAVVIFISSGEVFRYSGISALWATRQNVLFFSGTVAYLYMTLAMCLILRSSLLNRLTGGLDKAWGIHKWTGIAATLFAVVHWLDEKVPQWLVNAGWLTHPGELGSIHLTEWQFQMIETAISLVQWALYATAALVIISLTKKIPYRWFRYLHRLFPVIYLVTALHVITVLFKSYWWRTPAGAALIIVTIPGVYAAIIALFRRIGNKQTHKATIEQIHYHNNNLIEVVLNTERSLISSPGQFAFVTFSHDSEPHPYTIASWSDDNKKIHFAIKALGDYTAKLSSSLAIGQPARIEGPYGKFNFSSKRGRQVWVAGGIGVTPFLSQLDYLAKTKKHEHPVDFWYCARDEDNTFTHNLAERCQLAGVKLHTVYTSQNQTLDAEGIMETCNQDKDMNIWFCGPQAFANVLFSGLQDRGIKQSAFHYDSFTMR